MSAVYNPADFIRKEQ